MANDMQFPPLVGWKSLLKGVVGAGFLILGISNPWGIIAQALLFIIGLLIIVDGVMVTGKGAFIVICMIAAVVSGAVTVVMAASGLGLPYLVILLVMALALYWRMLSEFFGKRASAQSRAGS